MSNVSIYACGGAGTNIIQESLSLKDLVGMPNLNISIMDTSQSNIKVNLEKEQLGYTFVEGLTGGGKDQKLAFSAAEPYVNDHLNKNRPGDYNIVLFSLSGASGSTIGSLITNSLLKRNVPVICFVIGSVEDGKQTENTFNTLRTLQNLSKSNGLPLTIVYHENVYDGEAKGRRGGERYVNEVVHVGMRDVCRLVNETHHGLDREDIRNWLYFNKVSDLTGLVELFTADNHEDLDALKGKVITTASLLPNQDTRVPSLMQPYSCKGYLSEALLKEFDEDFDGFHYLISKGFIKGTYNRIKMKQSEFEEAKAKLQSDDFDEDLDDMLGEDDSPFQF